MSLLLRLCFSLVLLAPALVRAATLENPATGSFYSGIGVISGWKCTANGPLTVRFNDGDPLPLAYGNARADVRNAGACRSAQVGFVSIMNWAELGDGTHTAVVYDNGVEFARSTFTVATTGEPFVTGAEGECRVPDFPAPQETMRFAWNQSTQHLEMVNQRGGSGSGGDDAPGVPRNVRVTEVGEDFVAVDWDPPTGGGAVSYNFYYRGPNEPEHLLGNVTTISAEVSGTVVPGECYRVAAVNAAGVEGEKSPEVCVWMQQSPDGGGGGGGPAALENPAPGSFYSGIGVISGWKCTATGPLTVRFNNGTPLPLAYGNARADVRNAGACPSAQVGFVSIMNWAELSDGEHTAVVYDNGVEFARSTFTVATTGEPYVTGAVGECRVPDFPAPGEAMPFAWNEATQHLEMVGDSGEGDEDDGGSSGQGDGGGVCDRTPKIRNAILTSLANHWIIGRQTPCQDITAEHLAEITSLQFYSLGISALKSGDFAGLANLRKLILPGNGLTTLPPDIFAGLANLRELYFYNNGLTSLPPDVFAGLANLRVLLLSGNGLTSLPPDVFAGLASLEALHLHDNGLTSLPPDVFAGLASLRILLLHNNGLTSLPPAVFAGLANLRHLHLHNNGLTSLPPDVFAGLPDGVEIDLRGNPGYPFGTGDGGDGDDGDDGGGAYDLYCYSTAPLVACAHYTFTSRDHYNEFANECRQRPSVSVVDGPCDPAPSCIHRSSKGTVQTYVYDGQSEAQVKEACDANNGTYVPGPATPNHICNQDCRDAVAALCQSDLTRPFCKWICDFNNVECDN